MSYAIFPISPLPANLEREPFWNSSVVRYESGVDQGESNWQKPLTRFGFTIERGQTSKLNSLEAFFHARNAGADPFLMKDPYFNTVSLYVMKAGGTAIKTGYMLNNYGHRVFPESGAIAMTSNLSGAYSIGSHYTIDSITGVINFVNTVAAADIITINSAGYFHLCRFNGPLRSTSPLWSVFNIPVSIDEILP